MTCGKPARGKSWLCPEDEGHVASGMRTSSPLTLRNRLPARRYFAISIFVNTSPVSSFG